MGARLLRSWINQPLLEINRLNARLDAVEALFSSDLLRDELVSELKQVADIERLTNRIVIGKAGPRDLLALQAALSAIPQLAELIQETGALAAIADRLDPCEAVHDLISSAIAEDPSATINAIGIIRAGYSEQLDHILASTLHAREWIANLESHERRRTGIASIKVGFNKVFGYYIEVTKAHSEKVPDDYVRKQTLVNAERYITPELKEYETKVLNAEEEILAIERELFADLCEKVGSQRESLQKTARAIAHLDAFLSLAEVAVREGYVRPDLTEDNILQIEAGRHPVVEKLLETSSRYVPNDSRFDLASRLHIITGPNMSGKSTYIRQVAIITLMAQVGSFCPRRFSANRIGRPDFRADRRTRRDSRWPKYLYGGNGRNGAPAIR